MIDQRIDMQPCAVRLHCRLAESPEMSPHVYLRGQAEACPGDGFLLVSLQLGGARQRGHLVPLPLCLELGSALERLKL